MIEDGKQQEIEAVPADGGHVSRLKRSKSHELAPWAAAGAVAGGVMALADVFGPGNGTKHASKILALGAGLGAASGLAVAVIANHSKDTHESVIVGFSDNNEARWAKKVRAKESSSSPERIT